MSDTLAAFEERVSKRLLQLRGRLEEFFKDYDTHHSKRVTKAQFVRACDLMGIRVSEREMAAIAAAYPTAAGDEFINYQALVDNVDTVFTRKNLVKDPDAEAEAKRMGRLHSYGRALDADEELVCSAVLRKVERMVATRGLIVKHFFLDHDRSNNGFVTPSQFDRAMEDCFRGSLGKGEIELLKKRYADDRGDICYKALHVDVTPDAVSAERSEGWTMRESRKVAELDAGYDSVDTESVMNTIIKQTASNRVRVKDFFREFDPMRTGHCTAAQFKRALISCKFSRVTEADMTALCRRFYTPEREKVNYAAFCSIVLTAFTQPALERNPTRTLDCAARTLALGPRHERPALDPIVADRAAAAMRRIKAFVIKRRLELVPLFQDFDRSHEEFVTRAQFGRVLKSVGCYPDEPAAVAALSAKYAGDGDKSAHIDWRAFLEDIEPNRTLQRAGARAVGSGGGAGASEAKAGDVSVLEVLKRVKLVTRKGQLRLEEFMRDYDKLRHNSITRHQFDTALSTAGVRLSAAETQALCEAFPDARGDVDVRGEACVAWQTFCDDVDAIFTVKGLEATPEVDVPSVTRDALSRSLVLGDVGGMSASRRLSNRADGSLRALLRRLSAQVSKRRLELTSFFQEFDRHRHGVLSKPQFLRGMDRAGLPLTTGDQELIFRAFAVPAADRVDINYRWFVESLGDVDGILAHLPGAGEVPAVAGGRDYSYTAPPVPRVPAAGGSASEVDLPDLLERIQSYFASRRVRMKEFMSDYDRLRTGHMAAGKLRTALAAAGIPLSPAELQALCETYADPELPDQIRWRTLAYSIDGGDEELERAPLKVMGAAPRRDMMATRGPSSSATEELLDTLANVVAVKNMLVKPFFRDYDPLRKSCCTKSQFSSVLQLLKLPVSESDVRVLQSAYQATGPGQSDRVNYLDFCRRIDPTER